MSNSEGRIKSLAPSYADNTSRAQLISFMDNESELARINQAHALLDCDHEQITRTELNRTMAAAVRLIDGYTIDGDKY